MEEIHNPGHYAWFEREYGVSLWTICSHMGFTLGNVLKYVFRAGRKIGTGQDAMDAKVQDLKKAREYLTMYIDMLEEAQRAKQTERPSRLNNE
jgi:hypothetical protein